MTSYESVRQLGKGRYGTVFLVNDNNTGRQYVQKMVDLSRSTPSERRATELEIKLLSTLRYPNIVRYRESFETSDGAVNIIMEYCELGDLSTHIRNRKGILFDELQILDCFVQICMALQYLHERNILHRDLKTQNIFLSKNNVIKVGDFGIAKVLDCTTDMATTLIGTPYYMSPEIFSNKPYNHKSDIWSLGCCLFELCTLRHAFNAANLNVLMFKVLQGSIPAVPDGYSPEISRLLRATLHLKAEKRPSASKILRHPFVKKHIVQFLRTTAKSLQSTNDNILPRCESSMSQVVVVQQAVAPLKLPLIDSVALGKSFDYNHNSKTSETGETSRKRRKSRWEIVKQHSLDKEVDKKETDDTMLESSKARIASAPCIRPRGKSCASERRVLSAYATVNTEGKTISKGVSAKHSRLDGDVNALIQALNETLRLDECGIADKELPGPSDKKPPETQNRLSTLRRRCTFRLNAETIDAAFELFDSYEGEELEEKLKDLLRSDYDTYYPLLFQLKLFDDNDLQQ